VVELAEEKRKRACWCATRRRGACGGRRGGAFGDGDVALQIAEAISTNLILGLTLQNQVWRMSDGLSLRRNTPGATLAPSRQLHVQGAGLACASSQMPIMVA